MTDDPVRTTPTPSPPSDAAAEGDGVDSIDDAVDSTGAADAEPANDEVKD